MDAVVARGAIGAMDTMDEEDADGGATGDACPRVNTSAERGTRDGRGDLADHDRCALPLPGRVRDLQAVRHPRHRPPLLHDLLLRRHP